MDKTAPTVKQQTTVRENARSVVSVDVTAHETVVMIRLPHGKSIMVTVKPPDVGDSGKWDAEILWYNPVKVTTFTSLNMPSQKSYGFHPIEGEHPHIRDIEKVTFHI